MCFDLPTCLWKRKTWASTERMFMPSPRLCYAVGTAVSCSSGAGERSAHGLRSVRQVSLVRTRLSKLGLDIFVGGSLKEFNSTRARSATVAACEAQAMLNIQVMCLRIPLVVPSDSEFPSVHLVETFLLQLASLRAHIMQHLISTCQDSSVTMLHTVTV